MPSLKDLLDAKQAAVVALEEKQRGYQLALDELSVARRRVETVWCAAVGGVALAHANEDSGFRAAFTIILDERLRTRRDCKLLAEWKAGPPPPPDQPPNTPSTSTTRARTARRPEPDLDLETVAGAELLENVKQLETNAQLLQKEVADAKAGADQAGKALRRRDDHWRIKVGETLLAHADDDDEFRQKLDRIFELRIAEHHRPLLDRWRNRTAPGTTPPPAASAHRGWKPKTLPDNSWGAVFPNPASKTLPDPLVGAAIVVRTSRGDEWITKITEVIEHSDAELLVRTEGRQDTGRSRSSPSAAKNQSAKDLEKTSDATVEENGRMKENTECAHRTPANRECGESRPGSGAKLARVRPRRRTAVAGHPRRANPVLRRPRRVPNLDPARADGRAEPLAA